MNFKVKHQKSRPYRDSINVKKKRGWRLVHKKKSAIWYRLFTLVLRGQGSTVKSLCQGQKSRSPNTYKLICHLLHVLLRPDISKRSRLKGQGYTFNISASVSYCVWMRQYWRCMGNSTQLSKLISITHIQCCQQSLTLITNYLLLYLYQIDQRDWLIRIWCIKKLFRNTCIYKATKAGRKYFLKWKEWIHHATQYLNHFPVINI